MKLPRFVPIGVAAGAVMLAGCPLIKVETTPPTNQAITQATTNVRDGLTTLGNGLAQFDPAGINRLLSENADLREKVERITASLNAAAGQGMIEIAHRAVQIRVVSYTGAFTIDGWVDQEGNKFWSSRTFQTKGFSFGDENDNLVGIRNASIQRFGNDTFLAWDHIARSAQGYFDGRVKSFLQNNTIVPGPDFETLDLNTNFGGLSGKHTIILRVTPIATDSTGTWSIRFHTILKKDNNEEEIIRVFDRTSTAFPNHLNQPLPDLEQSLLVKVAG